MSENSHTIAWQVNVQKLFKEVLKNPSTHILAKPFQILSSKLLEVAERASELNDDKLNLLMLELALYEAGDPYHKNYDPETVDKLREKVRGIKAPASFFAT